MMMKYEGLFVFKMNIFLLMIDLQNDEETKKVTEAGEKTDEQKKEEGIIKVQTEQMTKVIHSTAIFIFIP